MIRTLNEASPIAFGLMDYWSFDGWFALKIRQAEHGAPALEKTVFPGIELRLSAPMQGRLNAHVLFSNEISDQHLKDFLSGLKLELINQPLSPDALIDYARFAGADKLASHGFDKSKVVSDETEALRAGSEIAEVNVDSYKEAIRNVPGAGQSDLCPSPPMTDWTQSSGTITTPTRWGYFIVTDFRDAKIGFVVGVLRRRNRDQQEMVRQFPGSAERHSPARRFG
uniref:hypothetical protein n=1 Tax=Mesorhizobium atlanticum TaxID=2233532 RepID=UPI0037038301